MQWPAWWYLLICNRYELCPLLIDPPVAAAVRQHLPSGGGSLPDEAIEKGESRNFRQPRDLILEPLSHYARHIITVIKL